MNIEIFEFPTITEELYPILSCHLAGAGNMVTMLIDKELGLDNFDLAEDIKKCYTMVEGAKCIY